MRVNDSLCLGCEACIAVCPHSAIELRQGRAWIDPSLCSECGACAQVCPQGAIQPTPDVIETTAPEQSALWSKPSPTIVANQNDTQTKIESPLYAVVSYIGREILPHVINALVARWADHQNAQLNDSTKVTLYWRLNNPPFPFRNQPLRRRVRFSHRKKGQNHWQGSKTSK